MAERPGTVGCARGTQRAPAGRGGGGQAFSFWSCYQQGCMRFSEGKACWPLAKNQNTQSCRSRAGKEDGKGLINE